MGQVKELLRRFGEPISVFGENESDKRLRLSQILTKLKYEKINETTGQIDMLDILSSYHQISQAKAFYTEGTTNLKNIRLWLAEYSITRAKKRIERENLNIEQINSRSDNLQKDKSNS